MEGLRAGLSENGKKTTFLYHNGEIIAECSGESVPIRRHIRGTGLSHVQTEDGLYHEYHQDEQGSTAYITGQDKTIENCYQYDAFGNLTEKKEGIANRILYTGQQYDQETGQYYLRARYYNPAVGRFLQEAHNSLERFWNQYRPGGELYREYPTIGEYNRAVYNSLLSTNKFTPQDAAYAVRRAYGQQRSAGFMNSDFVPGIPGKLPQRR